MPSRKQIGVPSAAPTRRSSRRVASRQTAPATESRTPPPASKAPKASKGSKASTASKALTGRRKLTPRAQAAIDEEVAEQHVAQAATPSKFESKSFIQPGGEGNDQFRYGEPKFWAGLKTLGIHNFELATPLLPFQYPVSGEMKLEIQSKDEYDRHTFLLLFRDEDDSHGFTVPFNNIDQVIVLSELTKANTVPKKPKQYRVLIIPTAAVGLSAIKQQYPQIISFSLPNKKADKSLLGQFGRAGDAKKDTYLSVFKSAFDKWLRPFGKSAIDATNITEAGIWEGKTTVKYLLKSEHNEKNVQASHAYFLSQGIAFVSDHLRFFAPFSSFTKSMLLLAYEGNSPVAVNYTIEDLTEPYFADAPGESQDKQRIAFRDLPVDLLDALKEWSEKNGIKTMRMNQSFYSYAESSPMTGIMPPGMMGMM